MSYFKVDDRFPDHQKSRKLGRDRLASVGLWTLCGAWSTGELSDGWVPDEVVNRYDKRHRYARRLVEVGLWHRGHNDTGEMGYWFHDAHDHQPIRAHVESERAAARERMRNLRAERVRANKNRTTSERSGERSPERSGERDTHVRGNNRRTFARSSGNRTNGEVLVHAPANHPNQSSNRTTNVVLPDLPSGDESGTLPDQQPNSAGTPTQRSKRITDAYAQAEPMCRWPAINGVVLKAIKAGKWSDGEIRAAVLRLAGEGRSVTVETLRVELDGLAQRQRGSTTDRRVAETLQLADRLAAEEAQ